MKRQRWREVIGAGDGRPDRDPACARHRTERRCRIKLASRGARAKRSSSFRVFRSSFLRRDFACRSFEARTSAGSRLLHDGSPVETDTGETIMGRRLYVGNLSYNTTELSLRDVFGQIGTVAETKLVTDRDTGRPRGFGFVEMSSDQEAQEAIQQLNGRELDGRAITVNEAQERGAGGGRGGGRSGGGGSGGRGRW
jgi:cold-inducible RNA-binding protein